MTGRNDPCPCKSGKKYKHCCIDKAQAAPPPRARQGMPPCTICRDAPSINALACKVCGKRYAFCAAHAAAAAGNMNGHVLRVHPGVVPDLRQKLAEHPEVLADLLAKAKEDPENWASFMAFVSGKKVEAPPPAPMPAPDPRAPGGPLFVDLPPEHDAGRCAAGLRLAAAPGQVVVSTQSGGWSVCFSRDPVLGWLLTMKLLTPHASIDADWKHLGNLVGAMGVPRDAAQKAKTGSIQHDPGGTHLFQWPDLPHVSLIHEPEEKPS